MIIAVANQKGGVGKQQRPRRWLQALQPGDTESSVLI